MPRYEAAAEGGCVDDAPAAGSSAPASTDAVDWQNEGGVGDVEYRQRGGEVWGSKQLDDVGGGVSVVRGAPGSGPLCAPSDGSRST